MFSPAAKAGVSAGSIINVINDWAIEAMDKPEVSTYLFVIYHIIDSFPRIVTGKLVYSGFVSPKWHQARTRKKG